MVSVITCTKRIALIPQIIRNFENQTIAEKELIIVIHGDLTEQLDICQDNIIILPFNQQKSLGECLNEAIKKSQFGIIAKFDDDDYYGPSYLKEAVSYLENNQADLVGKETIFVYFQSTQMLGLLQLTDEKYLNLAGSTLVFRKHIAVDIPFPPLSLGEDAAFLEGCHKKSFHMASTSPFHYVYVRYSNAHHTSTIKNEQLMRRCRVIKKTHDFKPFVNQEEGDKLDEE